jgi:hypothetical protein
MISTNEIAAVTPNDTSDEISRTEIIAAQEDLPAEFSRPETVPVAMEAEGSPEDVAQSELVDAAIETPTIGAGTATEAEVARTCQVCGASNNFGSKRSRKHRQKNRVESLV